MKPEDKLRAGLPITIRDVMPMSVYDAVRPEDRAGVAKAQAVAVTKRISRTWDAVIQKLDDIRDAEEERQRERRRRGR